MSVFTKALVLLTATLFFGTAIAMAIDGKWGAAMAGFLMGLIVCFIGLQGVFWPWFYKRYPLPERKPLESAPGIFDELKIYSSKNYPAWVRWPFICIIALWVLAVVLRLLDLLWQR